jgi:transcriptional regulator with XRE-family HTH domain
MPESSMFRRRQLGIALRRLREAARLDQADVADKLGCAASRVSRIETATQPITPKELATVLSLYGVPAADRAELVALQAAGQQRSSWTYRDPRQLPRHLRRYLDVETAAEELLIFQIELIPGLVQTPEYSRALLTAGAGLTGFTSQDVEQAVALRQERQLALSRQDPVRVKIVISAAALRRVIGNAAVMAAQLRHLAGLAEAGRIAVQVIPFDVEGYSPADVAFTLITFPGDGRPSVAYVEGLASATHVEDADGLRLYAATYAHLTRMALSAEVSARFILEVADGYDQGGDSHD